MQDGGGAAEPVGGSADACGDRPAAGAAGRSGGKPAVRRGGERPPRQRSPKGGGEVRRLQVSVPADLRRLLGVHCAITEEDESEVVVKAVQGYLHRHGKGQHALDTKSPADGPAAEQPSGGATERRASSGFVVPAQIQAKIDARKAAGGIGVVRPDTPEDRQEKRAG